MDPVEALMEKLRQDNSLLAKAKELTEADTIRSYDGQIPQELLDAAIDEIDGRNWRYGWKSSKMLGFGHWNVVLSDSKIEREEVYHEVPQCIRDLWDYIQPRFMPTTPVLVRAYSNAHTYGVEGYIHRDSKFATDQTCIIYVEKDWKPEWAGETVFFDEDEDVIKAILPRYGRFTIFPGNVKHVGRGVSRICPTIRRVLVLKGKPRE
jgi:SM-20-related protein